MRTIRRHQAAAAAPDAREVRPVGVLALGSPVIDFRGVSKRYPGGDIGLDQVTFSIDRGDFVFLVGATGSGKSTVMRLLIKELEPTAGTIRVAGHDLGAPAQQGVCRASLDPPHRGGGVGQPGDLGVVEHQPHHGQTGGRRGANELESWVRKKRRTGIGNNRYPLTRFEIRNRPFDFAILVMFVERSRPSGD